mmetsp:Transcript_735/g.1457  ORF Transcript_735/g.1457 Transcript_735/m.1457 type:complete len:208 (-) Transcript_735:602-1225(-)
MTRSERAMTAVVKASANESLLLPTMAVLVLGLAANPKTPMSDPLRPCLGAFRGAGSGGLGGSSAIVTAFSILDRAENIPKSDPRRLRRGLRVFAGDDGCCCIERDETLCEKEWDICEAKEILSSSLLPPPKFRVDRLLFFRPNTAKIEPRRPPPPPPCRCCLLRPKKPRLCLRSDVGVVPSVEPASVQLSCILMSPLPPYAKCPCVF